MNFYLSGKTAALAAVASALACTWLRDGFYLTNPLLFWGTQAVLAAGILASLVYAVKEWKPLYHVPRGRFLLSVCLILSFYVIAWTRF